MVRRMEKGEGGVEPSEKEREEVKRRSGMENWKPALRGSRTQSSSRLREYIPA